jgi:hypothetical protein
LGLCFDVNNQRKALTTQDTIASLINLANAYLLAGRAAETVPQQGILTLSRLKEDKSAGKAP